jgi:hypothetical protein
MDSQILVDSFPKRLDSQVGNKLRIQLLMGLLSDGRYRKPVDGIRSSNEVTIGILVRRPASVEHATDPKKHSGPIPIPEDDQEQRDSNGKILNEARTRHLKEVIYSITRQVKEVVNTITRNSDAMYVSDAKLGISDHHFQASTRRP